jgi:hypothetical protein
MSTPTDEVKARILYSSAKTLNVIIDNQPYWIPKSIIHNDYQESDTELEQVLEVDLWFLQKNEIEGW